MKCKLDEYYEKISGGEAARLFGDEFTQEEEDLTGVCSLDEHRLHFSKTRTEEQRCMSDDLINSFSISPMIATVPCAIKSNGDQSLQEGIPVC